MEEERFVPNLEILNDLDAVSDRCTEVFIADARKNIEEKGWFSVAISGGHTPKGFFEKLGTSEDSLSLQWDKIQLFWVDERYVSPDSQWSNYKLAADTFLNRVDIPDQNVHRIPTDYSDFQQAAVEYESTIRSVFNLQQGQYPVFDMIVLGMGADGHIGSLFPNSYASFDTEDLACVVYVMDEKLNRITLTHSVIENAAHLLVLVSGSEKATVLKEIFTGEQDEVKYPIQTLWPVLDKVTWLVDEAAAQFLRPEKAGR